MASRLAEEAAAELWDGELTVSVEVENIGKRAGDEVVQIYIRDMAASVTRPVRELKASTESH